MLGSVDQTSLALKIDAGSLTYQKAPIPLATVVRAGVDAAAVPLEMHTVHVLAQEDVSLFVDGSRITELVRQLVDNASKYSPAGTPITVRAVAEAGSAVIEITDEGPGIPTEHSAKRSSSASPGGDRAATRNSREMVWDSSSAGPWLPNTGGDVRRGRPGRGYDAPRPAAAGGDLGWEHPTRRSRC